MSPAEIISMAREAGLPDAISAHPGVKDLCRRVAASEREACAKVCEERADVHEQSAPHEETKDYQLRMMVYAKHERRCAAAIRARGDK